MKHTTLLRIWFLIMLPALSGCVSTYRQTEVRSTETHLDQKGTITVSVPEDGRYASDVYNGSGEMTAAAVKAAFSRYASDVVITREFKSIGSFKNKTSERNGYFVKPSILHWEERATEWSGKPDRIEIQIQIYDLISGLEIRNFIYTGKSKWATFGGDHPQDLLREPTQRFVDSLYKK